MKKLFAWTAAILLANSFVFAGVQDDTYRLGPDSEHHDGVPQGKIVGPIALTSNVYPDTTRDYWVYVPSQYNPKKPASLMVFFDGHAFVGLKGEYRIPNVFDNLIYRREMPVTIAVFINPGHTAKQKEASDSDWGDGSTNRRVEYNALDDKYSKLIVDELLPAIKKQYNISDDPENRAISGASSGAICAFTVAWHRPDQFRKVISTIGSFTNIMGGHVYPDLIRKSDPKPIRIFLQDGVNDNRGLRRGGEYDPKWDWHAQNIKMVEVFKEKKYDVNFTWGIGTHSNKQGGAIMPEMLRWLWRDYPRTDDAKDESNRTLLGPGGVGITPPPQRRQQPPIVLGPDDKAAYPAAPDGFDKPREGIAHGKIETVEYNSTTVGNKRKMLVYTPPGYEKSQAYQVLYLLHGIGGDEEEWHKNGSPEVIFDNLYADKKITPMIVVLPNGRAQKNDRAEGNIYASAPAFETFEGDLLKDIIPFMDENYHVAKGQTNRAIAGLSMGGGQSLNFGLGNLDTFAWVGGFSSAPNTKAPETLVPKPEEAKQKLMLLWISCGDKDGLIHISQKLHTYLKEKNVPHIWHVDSGAHTFPVWKNDLYLFAQRIFR